MRAESDTLTAYKVHQSRYNICDTVVMHWVSPNPDWCQNAHNLCDTYYYQAIVVPSTTTSSAHCVVEDDAYFLGIGRGWAGRDLDVLE